MSGGHAGCRLHIWSISWSFLTTLIQSLQALLPVATASINLLVSHSVVFGRIYIYIYNWRQTPRKVPLVRPSVKPPGFMPCCAGSFNRSLDVELGSLGISVVDPQRPHVSTALLYSSHLPTPCFLTIYSPFLYHIYSFFLSSLTV